jgi:flagellar basal body-associated protein FliL
MVLYILILKFLQRRLAIIIIIIIIIIVVVVVVVIAYRPLASDPSIYVGASQMCISYDDCSLRRHLEQLNKSERSVYAPLSSYGFPSIYFVRSQCRL